MAAGVVDGGAGPFRQDDLRNRPRTTPFSWGQNVRTHHHLFLISATAEPTCRIEYPERGAEPDRRLGGVGVQRDGAEVTITNRTWSTMEFTLSGGRYLGPFVLRPAEAVSGRGLGGLRITYHDGRGRSTVPLQPGQRYQFVERGGLFLLERTW